MKHLAVRRLGHGQGRNGRARGVLARITLRRQHHAQRRARIPVGLDLIQPAIERRLDQVHQVRAQTHHDRLRFRITQAAIELQHPRRAVDVDHEPGVQKTGVGRAVGGQGRNGGLDHLRHDAGVDVRRDHRRRRIRAHAAGVGAQIAVVACLVVLRGGQRQDVTAVDHDDETGLLADQEVLHHHARPGTAKRTLAQHGAHGGFGFVAPVGDHHALAGRQTVGLDHHRQRTCANVRQRGGQILEGLVGGGRNGVPAQELLGVGLGTLQLRGGLARPEAAPAGGGEGVHHTGHQRAFRADHGQIDRLALRKRQQARHVLAGDGDVAHLRLGGRPRIAGRDVNALDAWRLRQFPSQGVLAAAGTNHQNFHGSSSSR